MQCCFTFDYFIQFMYLKTNAIDLPKKKKKKIILIFFIVIWQYSFSLNILNRTETVTLKPWYKPNRESWTVPPLVSANFPFYNSASFLYLFSHVYW